MGEYWVMNLIDLQDFQFTHPYPMVLDYAASNPTLVKEIKYILLCI